MVGVRDLVGGRGGESRCWWSLWGCGVQFLGAMQ